MKTLVIGGGMAGLTYAIVACKNGWDVTVAERNGRVGKKIAMTGNGKCNIGNVNVSASCYNRSGIVLRVLQALPVCEYVRFLNSCGVYTYTDDEGRMYPLSDSAAGVVDCLRYQLSKFGGKLLADTVATSIVRRGDAYDVNLGGKTVRFDKVVVAVGSRSQAVSTGIEQLVSPTCLTPTVPSLVPVKVLDADVTLNGLRARAIVSLFDGEKLLATQQGEVLFREYGLSGICIFNLSALIARREVQRKRSNYHFELDLVPDLSEQNLQQTLCRRFDAGERDKAFFGILHNKLAAHILRRAGNSDASKTAHLAKHLTFRFDRLLDWSMSQVTAGGVDEGYLDPDTLQLPNGVTVLGEALNVDGICGGFNLYFAAASALYIFSPQQRQRAFSIS